MTRALHRTQQQLIIFSIYPLDLYSNEDYLLNNVAPPSNLLQACVAERCAILCILYEQWNKWVKHDNLCYTIAVEWIS